MEILFVLFLCIMLAYILAELCEHVLRIPRVVGQISAGLVLGFPGIKEYLFTADTLGTFGNLADLGAVLLFFFVGLQLNFRDFRLGAKTSLAISLAKNIPLFAGGYLFSSAIMGFPPLTSAIIGVCLTISAIAVTADILEELNLLKTRLGKLILTTGAVDDLIQFILIGSILLLINSATAKVGFIILARDLVLFLLALILFRALFIPFIFKSVEREQSPTTLFTGALIIVLLMAGFGEMLQIGSLIGALFAGILVRQTLLVDEKGKSWEEHSIAKMIHIIGFGFLIPIFFIWAGLTVNLSALSTHFNFLFWITAIVFAGTVGGTMLGLHLIGRSWREGWLMGWGLNAKGDVELAIATLALSVQIITVPIYSTIILMALITTIISPIVFRRLVERVKSKI